MTLIPATNPGAPRLDSETWVSTNLSRFGKIVCPIHRSLIAMSGLAVILLTASAQAAPKTLLANTFGATPDGHTLTTAAIQRALDTAAKTPGTTVILAPGTYLTGSIFIKSNTTLRLDAGVTLLGSQNIKDYATLPTRIAGKLFFVENLSKSACQAPQACSEDVTTKK